MSHLAIFTALFITTFPINTLAEVHKGHSSRNEGVPLIQCGSSEAKAQQKRIEKDIKALVKWEVPQRLARDEFPSMEYRPPTASKPGKVLSNKPLERPFSMTTEQMFLAWEESKRARFIENDSRSRLDDFFHTKLLNLGASFKKYVITKKKGKTGFRDIAAGEKDPEWVRYRFRNEFTSRWQKEFETMTSNKKKLGNLILRLFACPLEYEPHETFHRYLVYQARHTTHVSDLMHFEREVVRGLVAQRLGDGAQPAHFDLEANVRRNSRAIISSVWGDHIKSSWQGRTEELLKEHRYWMKAYTAAKSLKDMASRQERLAQVIPIIENIRSEIRALENEKVSHLKTAMTESRNINSRQRLFEELGLKILKETGKEDRAILLPEYILWARDRREKGALERFDEDVDQFHTYIFGRLNHLGAMEYGSANFLGQRTRPQSDSAANQMTQEWLDLNEREDISNMVDILQVAHRRTLKYIDRRLVRQKKLPLDLNNSNKWNDYNTQARFQWWEEALKSAPRDSHAIDFANFSSGILKRKNGFIEAAMDRKRAQDQAKVDKSKEKGERWRPGEGPRVLSKNQYEAKVMEELHDQFKRVRLHFLISESIFNQMPPLPSLSEAFQPPTEQKTTARLPQPGK